MPSTLYYSLFPYLKGSERIFSDYLKERGIKLGDLFDLDTSRGVYLRLISALREWRLGSEKSPTMISFFHPKNSNYSINSISSRDKLEVIIRERLTYLGAVVILAEIGDRLAMNRYSIFESKRFSQLMTQLGSSAKEYELRDMASELGMEIDLKKTQEYKEVDGARVIVERSTFLIPFQIFLSASPSRIGKWKMINHVVHQGNVWISTRREFLRIMEHFVAKKVGGDIKRILEKKRGEVELPESLEKILKGIRAEIERYRAKISEENIGEEKDFPPCMRAIISQIRSGSNVSHKGRFAITTFLHKIGWSEERILELMRNLPDFDERVATYQVKHILGEISRKEYEVPSCDTMRSYGLCFPDELCRKVKHPLQYLRRKSFLRRRGGK